MDSLAGLGIGQDLNVVVLFCYLPVKAQIRVSHLYKTTGKIIVLCILIIFVDSRQEHKRF
jgi:hypothetical protein